MARLTKEECRLLIERLDSRIYDLCTRLNPDIEGYVGQEAETQLSAVVTLRQKLIDRLPGERFNPLWRLVGDTGAVVNSRRLRALLREPEGTEAV